MKFGRFVPVALELLDSTCCTGKRLAVYSLLLMRSQNGGRVAYGGRISISKQLGISERTAWLALAWLESQGALVKVYQSRGGRKLANIYRVIIAGYRAGGQLAVALTSKLSNVLRSNNPSRHKTIVHASREIGPPPDIVPGSPHEKVRSILNYLKSPNS